MRPRLWYRPLWTCRHAAHGDSVIAQQLLGRRERRVPVAAVLPAVGPGEHSPGSSRAEKDENHSLQDALSSLLFLLVVRSLLAYVGVVFFAQREFFFCDRITTAAQGIRLRGVRVWLRPTCPSPPRGAPIIVAADRRWCGSPQPAAASRAHRRFVVTLASLSMQGSLLSACSVHRQGWSPS